MRKIFILLFTLVCLKGFTQNDTIFYDENEDKVASLSKATFYSVITKSVSDTSIEIYKTYTKTGHQTSEAYFTNDKRTGTWRSWFDNEKIRREIEYKNNEMNGSCKTYWENGQLKRNDVFENGKFISGNCYTTTGKDTTHYDFEILPEFKGGYNELVKYLQKTVKYPKKSNKKGIQGRVLLKFIVEIDGSITNVKVKESVNEELDAEAIRVVQSMPKWTSGFDDGRPTRVYYHLPIRFKLNP